MSQFVPGASYHHGARQNTGIHTVQRNGTRAVGVHSIRSPKIACHDHAIAVRSEVPADVARAIQEIPDHLSKWKRSGHTCVLQDCALALHAVVALQGTQ